MKYNNDQYPKWGDNEAYRKTMSKLKCSPKERYTDIARAVEKHFLNIWRSRMTHSEMLLDKENKSPYYKKSMELGNAMFDILWKGYLIPSSPVMTNYATDLGMPISCFGSRVKDDMYEIARKQTELTMLSKIGGGTSMSYQDLRPIGAPIKGGLLGKSDGVIPFCKVVDSTIISVKQGDTRRGNVALYLSTEHEEAEEFLAIRKDGDLNRRCHNIHHGMTISDKFMKRLEEGDDKARNFYKDIVMTRVKTGEPYTIYIGNARRFTPEWWNEIFTGNPKNRIIMSNLCTEIFLPLEYNETFVCCLSSLNLVLFDEWKDIVYKVGDEEYSVVQLSLLLLDAVIDEFITKGSKIRGIEDAIRFSEKYRALGLGTLGYHTYLQNKNLPFNSIASTAINRKIYKFISDQADEMNLIAGRMLGTPYGLRGSNRRWLTTIAIAPNRNSARMAGGVSEGVQPIESNYYVDGPAEGTFTVKNPLLTKLLIKLNKDTPEVWRSILEKKGSIQHLDFISDDDKEVFLTFREINMLELVKQAGDRQKYIDQGQSINLAFPKNAPAKWMIYVHYMAWKVGVKSLYYFKSEPSTDADLGTFDECVACEG